MAEHINGLLAKEKFNLRPQEEIQMYLKSRFIAAISYSTQKKQMSAKLGVLKDHTKKVRQFWDFKILHTKQLGLYDFFLCAFKAFLLLSYN